MRLLFPHLSSRSRTARAFTLAEIMVTLAIFSLVVIGMVSLQIFGFKMNSFTATKLKATSDTLRVLDHIRNDILEATNSVLIGNYNISNGKFTAVPNGQPATGSALLISNNLTNFIAIYLDTNTGKLYEEGNTNDQSTLLTLSSSIANSKPFQALDCFGNTNAVGSSTHYTIKTTLLFSNLVYAVPTPIYDTFLLQSCATPRELSIND